MRHTPLDSIGFVQLCGQGTGRQTAYHAAYHACHHSLPHHTHICCRSLYSWCESKFGVGGRWWGLPIHAHDLTSHRRVDQKGLLPRETIDKARTPHTRTHM